MIDRLMGLCPLLCFVLHLCDVRAFFLLRQPPASIGSFAERWVRNSLLRGTGCSVSDMTMQMTTKSSSNRNGKGQLSTQSETVSAYGIDIPVPLSARSSLKCEVDYLGMINFCLRKIDTALSGSSKSKMLNAISNEVFRALMIAYEPRIEALASQFPFFREQLGSTKCYLDANNMISLVPPPRWDPNTLMRVVVAPEEEMVGEGATGDVCRTESAASVKYLQALEGLLTTGQRRTQPIGDVTYDTGYSRLVTLLREAGCRFESDTGMGSEGGGGAVSGDGAGGVGVGSASGGSKVFVVSLTELPDGQRKVVDTPKGAVIVTNQGGKLYAVNAKCPHLGLPMKTGTIGPDATTGQPIITCKFHNSKFNLEDGKCVTWCSGVMGIPGTEKVAGAMGKFGGKAGSPATVYPVEVVEGQVYIQLDATSSSSSSSSGNALSIFDPLGMVTILPVVGRPRPTDSRICLSLLDSAIISAGGTSKTIELNTVANCVSRSMLYGTKNDKDEIAQFLDEMADSFPTKWSLKDGADGQEVRLIRALSVLLRSGLTAAAEATTFIGGPSDWLLVGAATGAVTGATTGPGRGTDSDTASASSSASASASSVSSSSSSSVGDRSNDRGAPPPASAYSTGTPLPLPLPLPLANVAKRGMVLTLPTPPLRLYDAYQNVFQRVIDSCFREISTRGGLIPPNANDELLMAFVLWEQSLRRNITDGIWQQNPSELVGTWELVDVAGQGSLEPILTAAASDFYFGMKQGVLVKLTDDGRVVVLGTDYTDSSDSSGTGSGSGNDSGVESASIYSDSINGPASSSSSSSSSRSRSSSSSSSSSSSTSNSNSGSGSQRDGQSGVVGAGITGLRWFFKPGPAHLDTLEFSIVSDASTSPDVFLRYTGFIDRGQRIESRFSRNPIRMTGRVVSTLRGEVQGSSRFLMVLKRN